MYMHIGFIKNNTFYAYRVVTIIVVFFLQILFYFVPFFLSYLFNCFLFLSLQSNLCIRSQVIVFPSSSFLSSLYRYIMLSALFSFCLVSLLFSSHNVDSLKHCFSFLLNHYFSIQLLFLCEFVSLCVFFQMYPLTIAIIVTLSFSLAVPITSIFTYFLNHSHF